MVRREDLQFCVTCGGDKMVCVVRVRWLEKGGVRRHGNEFYPSVGRGGSVLFGGVFFLVSSIFSLFLPRRCIGNIRNHRISFEYFFLLGLTVLDDYETYGFMIWRLLLFIYYFMATGCFIRCQRRCEYDHRKFQSEPPRCSDILLFVRVVPIRYF